MTRLQELKAKQEQLKAEMLEESKRVFAEETKVLFEAHPRLQSFSWTQYTPFFNDGEECVFSANKEDLNFIIDGIPEDETNDIGSWTLKSDSLSKYQPILAQDSAAQDACRACLEVMSGLGNEQLKEMFGDHVKVIAGRDGVDTEEYSHD